LRRLPASYSPQAEKNIWGGASHTLTSLRHVTRFTGSPRPAGGHEGFQRGRLARAVVIIVVFAVAAVVALRLRQRQAISSARASQPRQLPWQRTEPFSAPRRPAIGAPREVHLHFHGVGADAAEILARVNGEDR
jgi:hypothetical protein